MDSGKKVSGEMPEADLTLADYLRDGDGGRNIPLYNRIQRASKKAGKTPARYILEDMLKGEEYSQLRTSLRQILIETDQLDVQWADVDNFFKNVQSSEEAMEVFKLFSHCSKADLVDALFECDPERFGNKTANYRIVNSLGEYLGSIQKKFGFNKNYLEDNSGPVSLDELFNSISFNAFEKNKRLRQILFGISINVYLKEFEKNPAAAMKAISADINKEQNNVKKIVLTETLKYYKDIDGYTVAGATSSIYDPTVNRKVPFPSMHQKMEIKFNVDIKRALIADEPGTGKTAIAVLTKLKIEEIKGRKIRALVVCPGSVIDQWEARIHEYTTSPQNVVKITSSNKDETIEKAKDADFVLISYDMIFRGLGINGKDSGFTKEEAIKIVDRLLELGFEHAIFDECHNGKNPEAQRSEAIRRFTAESIDGGVEYLSLLSGTPLPNHTVDMAHLVVMLRPIILKNMKNKILNERKLKNEGTNISDKELETMALNKIESAFMTPSTEKEILDIRKAIKSHMVRSLSKDVMDLPPLSISSLKVRLSKEEREAYDAVHLPKEALINKMIGLRKKAIGPAKYAEVVKQVRKWRNEGHKSVIFSSVLKEGITRELEEILANEGFKVGRIDGSAVDSDEKERYTSSLSARGASMNGGKRDRGHRNNVLDWFNDEGEVLVVTLGTVGEGVDNLKIASKGMYLDWPWNHKDLDQGNSRLHRKGQKNPVEIIVLEAEGTIDEGFKKLIDMKRTIASIILDGMHITPKQGEMYNDTNESMLSEYLKSPHQKLAYVHGCVVDQGYDVNYNRLKSMEDKYAEVYCTNMETSYAMNTARVYSNIISEIERRGKVFRNPLDVASGPCMLSLATGKNTTAVDMLEKVLEKGQNLTEGKNRCVVGRMDELQKLLGTEKFDLTVCSLALHWAKSGDGERERVLRNINFVTEKGGYVIITIPQKKLDTGVEDGSAQKTGQTETGEQMLYEGMGQLGFDVIKGLSGTVVATEPADTNFKVHIVVARKTENVALKGRLEKDYFFLNNDSGVKVAKGSKQMKAIADIESKCTEFAIMDSTTRETTSVKDAAVRALTPITTGPDSSKLFLITDKKDHNELMALVRKYGLPNIARNNLGKLGNELDKLGYKIVPIRGGQGHRIELKQE